MPRRRDHADDLRDALLSLALIPIAGLHTASYWFRETLERTFSWHRPDREYGSAARWRPEPVSEAVADVLARDLRGGSYPRHGQPAHRFGHLLHGELSDAPPPVAQLQPDATTDLRARRGRADARAHELDRLALVVRSEAARPPFGRRQEATPVAGARPVALVGAIESSCPDERGPPALDPRRAEVNLDADDARTVRAVDLCRWRSGPCWSGGGLTESSDRALLERARHATDLDHPATAR
jgi:hypothetical protein